MNPRRRITCWGIVLTLSLIITGAIDAAAQSSPPASKTYLVVGTSLVQKGGLNAAKEQAIANGKRVAVEQMTAELLPLEMLVQHFGHFGIRKTLTLHDVAPVARAVADG